MRWGGEQCCFYVCMLYLLCFGGGRGGDEVVLFLCMFYLLCFGRGGRGGEEVVLFFVCDTCCA